MGQIARAEVGDEAGAEGRDVVGEGGVIDGGQRRRGGGRLVAPGLPGVGARGLLQGAPCEARGASSSIGWVDQGNMGLTTPGSAPPKSPRAESPSSESRT